MWTDAVRPLRFLVAGAANAAISYAAYLLLNIYLDFRVAYSASFALGILIAFLATSIAVFDQPVRWSRLPRYALAYVLQYGLGLGLVWVLVAHVGLNESVAPLLVAVLSAPVAYVVSRWLLVDADAVSAR